MKVGKAVGFDALIFSCDSDKKIVPASFVNACNLKNQNNKMHLNKLLADLNYNLEQNPWIDRLPSKNPTGGVAWGPCVYIIVTCC